MHQSIGVIVATGTEIGENCTMFAGASIAYKANGKDEGVPKIGNNVKLTMGSKVLGGVRIGDNVVVGANAVVLSDIPSNCIAVGAPARTIAATIGCEDRYC